MVSAKQQVSVHGVGDWEAGVQTSLTVPPDRAITEVRLGQIAKSVAKVATLLQSRSEEVRGKLGGHFTAETTDYDPPQRMSDGRYQGRVTLRVSARFAPDSTTEERMRVLDALLERLPEPDLLSKLKKSSDDTTDVRGLTLVVDEPDKYRQQLLEQYTRRLREACAVEAPQWKPEDLRICSDGMVEVVERRVSGIVLRLAVHTQLVSPPNAVSAAAST